MDLWILRKGRTSLKLLIGNDMNEITLTNEDLMKLNINVGTPSNMALFNVFTGVLEKRSVESYPGPFSSLPPCLSEFSLNPGAVAEASNIDAKLLDERLHNIWHATIDHYCDEGWLKRSAGQVVSTSGSRK